MGDQKPCQSIKSPLGELLCKVDHLTSPSCHVRDKPLVSPVQLWLRRTSRGFRRGWLAGFRLGSVPQSWPRHLCSDCQRIRGYQRGKHPTGSCNLWSLGGTGM